ncbi:MAG: hypothetical protein QF535_19845, partial [Anaerolineales bacterium]|nr:hypothetical protein [Anaerolineales bacterium]
YGQAMIQVGKLEHEIALLKETSTQTPEPSEDIIERINQYESDALRQQEIVKSLRSQIKDLQFQLSQAEETKGTMNENKRNTRSQNRKHHRRHWWQLWRPRKRTRQAK